MANEANIGEPQCAVVDGVRVFVSSANFAQQGQKGNVEIGMLNEDAGFASYLRGPWLT